MIWVRVSAWEVNEREGVLQSREGGWYAVDNSGLHVHMAATHCEPTLHTRGADLNVVYAGVPVHQPEVRLAAVDPEAICSLVRLRSHPRQKGAWE